MLYPNRKVKQFNAGNRINWSHPLTNNLYRALVCNGGANSSDLVTGKMTGGSVSGAGVDPIISPTPYGLGWNGGTGTSPNHALLTFFPSCVLGQNRFTVVIGLQVVGTPTNGDRIYSEHSAGSPKLIIDINSSAALKFQIFGNDFDTVDTSSPVLVQGKFYVIAYTFDRPASKFTGWCNGQQIGQTTSTPGETAYSGTEASFPPILNGTDNTAGRNTIPFVYFWRDRILTQQELMLLTQDPLVFLKPANYSINYYFVPEFVNLTFSDSLSLVDSPSIGLGFKLSDGFSISDTFTFTVPRDISVSDGFTISDTFAYNLLGLLTLVASDAIEITDSISLKVAIQAHFGDSIILSDSILTSISSILTQILSDTLLITDQVNLELKKKDNFSDAVTISDSAKIVLGINLTFSDGLTIVDEAKGTNPPLGIDLTFSDGITLTDTLSRNLSSNFPSYIRRYLNDVPR